jgi:hypothetical protein
VRSIIKENIYSKTFQQPNGKKLLLETDRKRAHENQNSLPKSSTQGK